MLQNCKYNLNWLVKLVKRDKEVSLGDFATFESPSWSNIAVI